MMNGLPHLHDAPPNFTPPSHTIEARSVQLDIVTGNRCPICQSFKPAIEALRKDLPNVTINVIDIDAPGVTPPRNVIAIPSFLINGYVVATGNPAVDELKAFIRSLN
jgi:hypothetical protein